MAELEAEARSQGEARQETIKGLFSAGEDVGRLHLGERFPAAAQHFSTAVYSRCCCHALASAICNRERCVFGVCVGMVGWWG